MERNANEFFRIAENVGKMSDVRTTLWTNVQNHRNAVLSSVRLVDGSSALNVIGKDFFAGRCFYLSVDGNATFFELI